MADRWWFVLRRPGMAPMAFAESSQRDAELSAEAHRYTSDWNCAAVEAPTAIDAVTRFKEMERTGEAHG